MKTFTAVIEECDVIRVVHFVGDTLNKAHENYRKQTKTTGPNILAIFEGTHVDIKAAMPEFNYTSPGGL